MSDANLEALLERIAAWNFEKAWETSMTRRACIAAFTYLATALLFWINGLPIPLLQAWIPTTAYLLSTLSLPWAKKRWMRQKQ